MNWSHVITNLPHVIGVAMSAVERVKGAKSGAEKEAAVIATTKDAIASAEILAGKDLINDAALNQLLANYISSRVALQNFLAAKAATSP